MSLNTLDKIKERLSARPTEIAALKEKGKKVVAWQGYNIPEEFIYALDLIPIRIGEGGDDRLVELGSRYISTKNCVYVRETLGMIADEKNPYASLADIFAFDTTCLQTFRVAEVVPYYFKKQVAILGVPRNFYWDEAQDYFSKEAEHFVDQLEEYSGSKLSKDRLEETVALYNKIREAIIRLYDLQSKDDNPLSWLDVYDSVQAGYFLDRKEFLELLTELADEAEKSDEKKKKNPDARIFLSGSVIAPGDRKLIKIILQSGGQIVGDDLWSGFIPYHKTNITDISVPGIARAYLGRTPHGALPYTPGIDSDRRVAELKELIAHYRAKGVIYHTLRYCDPYTFKAKETKDILSADGIGFLEIHTEYAGSDYEAIHTRVEAFVEMLENSL